MNDSQWWIIFERRDVPTWEPNGWPFGYVEVGKFNGTTEEAQNYANGQVMRDGAMREVVLFPMDTAIRVTQDQRIDKAMAALST